MGYEFYRSHIMPLEYGNDHTAKIIPKDINIWISKLFLGDSDGFSILVWHFRLHSPLSTASSDGSYAV